LFAGVADQANLARLDPVVDAVFAANTNSPLLA